jgi:hypothetical protein
MVPWKIGRTRRRRKVSTTAFASSPVTNRPSACTYPVSFRT